MQQPDKCRRYFFVDESGDPTFFDRHGNCIVGNPGCSKYLMLGYIRTEEPVIVRKALSDLRKQLEQDTYINEIPSFKKTRLAFHAKDDSPEVRREVFKLIPSLPVHGHFILARKRLRTFRKSFNSKEEAFYDHLVTHLFKRSLHLAIENKIYFATRGSRARQKPLTHAVRLAAQSFNTKFPGAAATSVSVECQSPIGEPCLQIIDYFLWAIQRLFVRREERFYKAIESQVEFIWDLYDTEHYPHNIYTSGNPVNINKISPL